MICDIIRVAGRRSGLKPALRCAAFMPLHCERLRAHVEEFMRAHFGVIT